MNVSGANAEFTVGSCEDTEKIYSFSVSTMLNSTQAVTAKAAIWGLTPFGSEPSFDNFVINAPLCWGTDTGKVFKFGRDLCSIDMADDETANTTTYTLDIATLMRLPEASPDDNFIVGDTIGIQDDVIGEEIIGQRIVSYEKHHDDPSQDKVTIGQFIPDILDTIQAIQSGVNSSVKQATPYSNVSIDHQNGFMATNEDGTFVVKMNGNDGFIATLGNVKVVMNGSDGFKIYNNGVLVGGSDTNGNFFATQISTPYSNVHGIIGTTSDNTEGLQLFDGSTLFAEILELVGGGVTIRSINQKGAIQLGDDGVSFFKNGSAMGLSGSIPFGNGSIVLENGIVNSYGYSSITGSIPISGVGTLNFNQGILTSIT